MSKKNSTHHPGEEGEKKSEAAIRLYRDRLKTLRKAQELSQSGNIAKAVEAYLQFLKAHAMWHCIKETELHPRFFDKSKDIAELLLMSHVYWDLAKTYDRNPNLKIETARCLNQFVKFTTGFKYQHVNAKMCKNYFTRRMAHNDDLFRDAYKRIQVESKACFLASFCFEEDALELQTFRAFKQTLLPIPLGYFFIEFYYRYSPSIIAILEKNTTREKVAKTILQPCLRQLAVLINFFAKRSKN